MLTLDGKSAPTLPNQGYMGKAPEAPSRMPQLPIDTRGAESVPITSGDSRMIFLRRDGQNWLVAFMGIRGLSANPMPLPFTRDESLRDVLEHLGRIYGGQLTGAWLLVAP